MRIIHIISTLDFGGAQKILVGLAGEAVKNGHDVEVISIYGVNKYQNELQENGINVTVLKESNSVNLKRIFELIRLSNQLSQILINKSPQLIHVHLFIPKLLLLFNKRCTKAPIIQTQHDNSPWWGKRTVMELLMSKVESYFSRHIAEINVAISESVRTDLINNFNLSPDKTPCIHNFVEDNPYSIEEKEKFENNFKVLLISRLDWEKKGLDIFLEIASRIISQLEYADIKFVIIGDGPDKIKMQNEVRLKGLSRFFHFGGYQKDVYLQYKNADVVVIPSRWEGFGLTAAEAAMAGVPVVGSNIGGLKEVVENNKSGILLEVGDIEGFSRSIIKLHDDFELYSRMSAYTYQRALRLYNKERVYIKYEDLYQSLIKY